VESSRDFGMKKNVVLADVTCKKIGRTNVLSSNGGGGFLIAPSRRKGEIDNILSSIDRLIEREKDFLWNKRTN